MAKCLQPLRIINPHYEKLANEHYLNTSSVYDWRSADDFYINVPCGRCINCQMSRSSSWRVRLLSEWRSLSLSQQKNTLFITFTLSDEYVDDFKLNPGKYVRKFCENYRQYYGKSIRHYFVTEFGELKGRIHLHGLLFDSLTGSADMLRRFWSAEPPPRRTKRNYKLGLVHKYWQKTLHNYGFIKIKRMGNIPISCTSSPSRVINYISTYVTKYIDAFLVDEDKIQKVFVSPGLGRSYTEDINNKKYALVKNDDNIVFNTTLMGFNQPYQMPRYYKLKMFNKYELKILKEYIKNVLDEQRFEPPFFIGKARYDDIYSFARACRDGGLNTDIDKQFNYYMYNKKF